MEIWKNVPGFENIYQASNMGYVRRVAKSKNNTSGVIISGYVNKKTGYKALSLSDLNGKKHWFNMHALICMTFNGEKPSKKHQCCHNDGDKMNNRADNLRWATRSENERDKIAHGRSNRGENHGLSKLKNPDIPDIRRMLSAGMSQKEIGKIYGVSASCINGIKTGKRWSSVN